MYAFSGINDRSSIYMLVSGPRVRGLVHTASLGLRLKKSGPRVRGLVIKNFQENGKMLKVKIKDFQSIADTEFEIDQFTVIVGKNNRGKSAIVRAIDAALSNRLGNSFIRWGKLQTEVGLKTTNLDISWKKGETTSYFDHAKNKPITSLNKAIPKPIVDAGFKKIEIADEKMNPLIAHQFEELFLINKSGPFVTEALSTLYDLNDINDADSLCQKKLRGAKSLLKTRQSDIDDLTEKIKRFEGIDELKKKWAEIKVSIEKAEFLKKEISDLDRFIFQIQTQDKIIEKLKPISIIKIPDLKKSNQLILDYTWLESIVEKFRNILNLVQSLKGISTISIPSTDKPKQLISEYEWLEPRVEKFNQLSNLVQSLKNVSTVSIPITEKIESLIKEISIIYELTEKLKGTVLTCNNCKKALAELINLASIKEKIKGIEEQVLTFSYIVATEKQFHDTALNVKQIKNFYEESVQEWTLAKTEYDKYEICPLCNNPLKK